MVYKLTYFNIRGRAEPMRLLFAHAGIEYVDHRVEFSHWPGFQSKTPWGSMPILEDGSLKLSQSVAILQYLGKKHGYGGKSAQDDAKCDEYIGVCNDFYAAYASSTQEEDAGKKEEKIKKFLRETCPFYLSKFEKILSKSGSFLVGDSVTYGDFYVAPFIDNYVAKFPNVMDPYPSLRNYLQRVFTLPGVKEWIATRPDTPS